MPSCCCCRSNSKDLEGSGSKRAREERAPATAAARGGPAPKSGARLLGLEGEGEGVTGADAAAADAADAGGRANAASVEGGKQEQAVLPPHPLWATTPAVAEAGGAPGSAEAAPTLMDIEPQPGSQQQPAAAAARGGTEPTGGPQQQQRRPRRQGGEEEEEEERREEEEEEEEAEEREATAGPGSEGVEGEEDDMGVRQLAAMAAEVQSREGTSEAPGMHGEQGALPSCACLPASAVPVSAPAWLPAPACSACVCLLTCLPMWDAPFRVALLPSLGRPRVRQLPHPPHLQCLPCPRSLYWVPRVGSQEP